MLSKKFLLEFPELRQCFNYSCGASALQSIFTYYGTDEREDTIMKLLDKESKDLKNNGADIKAMKAVALEYGYECVIEYDLPILTLKTLISKKIPVILILQAWHEEKPFDYKESYVDGHYVIAIGWNNDRIIFEDPLSYNRVYLTEKELANRWHAIDDKGNPDPRSVSIIIDGEPNFDQHLITRLG